MMMALSPPGLPSEFSLRMEFASCESFAIPRVAAPAIKTRADRAEPNRMAKVLRVEVKFICLLLSIDNLEFVVRGKANPTHQSRLRWRRPVFPRRCESCATGFPRTKVAAPYTAIFASCAPFLPFPFAAVDSGGRAADWYPSSAEILSPAPWMSGANWRRRVTGIRKAGAVMLRLDCTLPVWSQI